MRSLIGVAMVALLMASLAPVAAAAQLGYEYVQNGSFEEGLLYWETSDLVRLSQDRAIDGQYSLLIGADVLPERAIYYFEVPYDKPYAVFSLYMYPDHDVLHHRNIYYQPLALEAWIDNLGYAYICVDKAAMYAYSGAESYRFNGKGKTFSDPIDEEWLLVTVVKHKNYFTLLVNDTIIGTVPYKGSETQPIDEIRLVINGYKYAEQIHVWVDVVSFRTPLLVTGNSANADPLSYEYNVEAVTSGSSTSDYSFITYTLTVDKEGDYLLLVPVNASVDYGIEWGGTVGLWVEYKITDSSGNTVYDLWDNQLYVSGDVSGFYSETITYFKAIKLHLSPGTYYFKIAVVGYAEGWNGAASIVASVEGPGLASTPLP